MNFVAVVGILMLYTYTIAIAAPSSLRYEDLDYNMTLTPALTSTANALPPDPNVINLQSIGRISCYAYVYSRWNEDIVRLVIYVVAIVMMHIHDGQGSQPVRYTQMYSVGHALFRIEPSPQLNWNMLSLVVGFIGLNNQLYTPATFLLAVSGGPSGDWYGSLTAD